MSRMFPASLGDTTLRWFNKLPLRKIDNFKELVEQFTARFIINIRIVKGPKALTHLKKKQGETLREYSQRYCELYQEIEDCDLRFTITTFKFSLLWDSNDIYNDLTRRPLKTFDDLLTRVDKFLRVEDDDRAANMLNPKREMGNDRKEDGNGKKNKKDDKKCEKKSGFEAFKAVNAIFTKPIHNIMFEIQWKHFFKWPKPLGGDLNSRDMKLRCSYHKHHGHRTKNCKTLKQFLERLVEEGHLAKYVKPEGKKQERAKENSDEVTVV